VLLSALLILATAQSNLPANDALAKSFRNPPLSARPHTWWHWMDGNVTKEGLTADLEAMKQAGIGGAQMFTVAQGIPKGPVDYMSPQWREMIKHAVKEAGRLGIELCLHNCAGWSSSGGPWVKPENAMQVISWSGIKVTGPKHLEQKLPPITPPQIYGSVDYKKDIAVYVFRTPTEGQAQFDLPTPPKQGADRSLFLGKTGVDRRDGLLPDVAPGMAGMEILRPNLFEITSNLDKDGVLKWDVPEGDWTILRIGHVPTGKNNHPAPPEGEGLEVDKMSREAMDAFWSGTMATVIKDLGPLAGRVLNNALIDSYEVGSQNWTPKFRQEFQRRRGYDPMLWLPAVTGLVIESKEKTERFLWDFRRTIADLFADNYYGYFKELCHKNGMLFSTEPYGNGGFDNIQAGGLADIPMGEFWVGGGTLETLKVASSSAHTNGRMLVGAESFTADNFRGRWLEEPYAAKALGDFVFTQGINRYIFHRYAHQPWMNLVPGMTMGPWGTHLERTQTWWTEAGEWLKYVARCQSMLQQGKFVADALYFYGESAPADLPYRPNLRPMLPVGYDYDGCDATVVNRLKVQGGRLVLPDGMSYRVLILPDDNRYMTPGMVRQISDLVKEGAVVLGSKPQHSPSLTDYPHCDEVLDRLADELWGADPGPSGDRKVGQGRIVWGKRLADVLESLRVPKDFEFMSRSGGSKLAYIHRTIEDAEVYFVSNQNYRPTSVECTFRVAGKRPELWHADSGEMEYAPVYSEDGRRTKVPLRLEPAESVFVVFRKPISGPMVDLVRLVGDEEPVEKTPTIHIVKARYESADGRGADVTDIVAQIVKEGQYEISATNGLFGDPVVNVVKRLVVTYERDGKPMTQTVAENETLSLYDLPKAPLGPPKYSFGYDGQNRLLLTPWVAGLYHVRIGGELKPIQVASVPAPVTLTGGWQVSFQPNRGAPPSAEFPSLASWAENSLPGIKYFSGSATYVKEFDLPKGFFGRDQALALDLGRVKNFATVRLNGKDLGVLWKEPFTVDISQAARAGKNRLEVKVTNLWVNRIIGDEQLPPDAEFQGETLKGFPEWLLKGQPRPPTGRITFTTWKFWNKDSPLLESGLLGPVTVRATKKIAIVP